jgi:hypothetical protein
MIFIRTENKYYRIISCAIVQLVRDLPLFYLFVFEEMSKPESILYLTELTSNFYFQFLLQNIFQLSQNNIMMIYLLEVIFFIGC